MTIYEQKIAKTKKADQKTARAAAERCYRYGRVIDDIYKAYGRPSLKKVQAWERCRRICEELDGYDMRIAGKGIYSFSVVFKFFDKENYKPGYAYITKDFAQFALTKTETKRILAMASLWQIAKRSKMKNIKNLSVSGIACQKKKRNCK